MVAPRYSAESMDEEQLINLIKEHRALYDTEHKSYEDQGKREAAWQEISARVQIPVSECKDRWKRLRDNYRKAQKLRQTKRSQGITKIKKIKHEKILSFLNDVIGRNYSDSETVNTGPSVVINEVNAHSNNEVIDPLQEMNVEPPSTKPDTVVTFFTNLGETVKNFPEEVQIRVKRDIFKIINEAEEYVCRSKKPYSLVKFEVDE